MATNVPTPVEARVDPSVASCQLPKRLTIRPLVGHQVVFAMATEVFAWALHTQSNRRRHLDAVLFEVQHGRALKPTKARSTTLSLGITMGGLLRRLLLLLLQFLLPTWRHRRPQGDQVGCGRDTGGGNRRRGPPLLMDNNVGSRRLHAARKGLRAPIRVNTAASANDHDVKLPVVLQPHLAMLLAAAAEVAQALQPLAVVLQHAIHPTPV
mmetsp:Transcript_78322/g.227218  ORF Transcript_78322/g.227218 Transcript_78322/m.227218 type:complete len:210 (+) Transcript_78322:650-1279(+)